MKGICRPAGINQSISPSVCPSAYKWLRVVQSTSRLKPEWFSLTMLLHLITGHSEKWCLFFYNLRGKFVSLYQRGLCFCIRLFRILYFILCLWSSLAWMICSKWWYGQCTFSPYFSQQDENWAECSLYDFDDWFLHELFLFNSKAWCQYICFFPK